MVICLLKKYQTRLSTLASGILLMESKSIDSVHYQAEIALK